jgi:DNA repair photolyase
MARRWDSIQITDDSGLSQTAVAPVIISASRSTDIPAFYSEWLMNRLGAGYCVWTNPFNGNPQYVSFKKARFFIFWSKNPKPMLPRLSELDRYKVGYYFQFTLNDYDKEDYEPSVSSVASRVETFKKLSDHVGPSRVIWRFDPLLITDSFTVDNLLGRIEALLKILHDHTEKLVFSFADIDAYQKVGRNLKRLGVSAREFTETEMNTVAKQIGLMAREYGITAATCAEKIDLSKYGVEQNRCIDDELIAKLCPNDPELLAFLGRPPQLELLLNTRTESSKKAPNLKDPGQRPACGCVMSKDIGSYNTCPHLCVYCYANASSASVKSKFREHDSESESV